MTEQIDKEEILPVLLFGRAGFDFCQIEVQRIEWLQGVIQATWLVFDREHDGCTVIAGRWADVFAKDEKAGGIGRAVLNAAL